MLHHTFLILFLSDFKVESKSLKNWFVTSTSKMQGLERNGVAEELKK